MSTTAGDRPDATVPPHDLDAEEALLGALMLSAGAMAAATTAGITAADFYRPEHGEVFKAMVDAILEGFSLDPVVIAARLDGRPDWRVRLRTIQAATPASANAPAYARIVRDCARRRDLIATAQEVERAARAGEDPAPIVARLSLAATPVDSRARMTGGGAFVLDAPDHCEVICGTPHAPLWARGESLLLVGPAGTGKTTLSIQLLGAGIGVLDDVLGWPVAPSRRTLYMACDRPAQFQRAARRVLADVDRDLLDERLVVWRGPPPRDLAKHPEMLLALARDAGADRVFIDSLKDVAIGISDDAVGSGLNSAIQLALAEGVDVCGLHHQRKGQNGTKPKTLEDVYGSTWIAAGAGSVALLWGSAGDSLVELVHLKQPAEPIGPLRIEHDHDRGISTISRGQVDPLLVIRNALGRGVTARDLAVLNTEKPDPSDNERKQAQRSLDRLVKAGLAHRTEPTSGGAGGTSPARYFEVTVGTESDLETGGES